MDMSFLYNWFQRFRRTQPSEPNDMNHLIVGLGNIGDEYAATRHNMGFRILDALAGASNAVFEDKRYGFVTEVRVKNQKLILLKPSTYMNLSGNAVRYWMSSPLPSSDGASGWDSAR